MALMPSHLVLARERLVRETPIDPQLIHHAIQTISRISLASTLEVVQYSLESQNETELFLISWFFFVTLLFITIFGVIQKFSVE